MSSRVKLCLLPTLAFAVLAAACSPDPEVLKREYMASGDKFFAEKKYGEAIIQYKNIINLDPRWGEPRAKLAAAYEEEGQLGLALGEFVRAADLMPNDHNVQLRAGKLLVAAGQFPEAKARATAVLEKEPRNVNALIVFGNALAGLKEIDAAVTQIQQAVGIDPSLTFGYTNLGFIQLRSGNSAAAEETFERAVKLAPTSLDALLNLGNYYWATGRFDEAEALFKRAHGIDPKSSVTNRALAGFYTVRGRQREAEPYIKTYAELATTIPPKLGLADFYVQQGRTQEAVALLEQLQKDKPAYIPATIRLAMVDFRAGHRDKAYSRLDEALKHVPGDTSTLELQAGFLIQDRKFAEALKIADGLVQRDAASVNAHLIRGQALQALGSVDEGIKAYQRTLELAPGLVPAQLGLGSLYATSGNTKTAIELLSQAVKAEPRVAVGHYALGLAYLQAGDLPRAEVELVGLSRLNPTSPEIQTALGRLYGAKNDLPRSRQAFAKALETQPNSLAALNGLVAADLVAKNYQAIRERLEPRLAAEPQNTALLFLAGNTYLTMGDEEKAEPLLKKVLQLDANHLDAYTRLAGVYLNTRRLDEAKKQFEEMAARQPRPVAALTMIGMILDLQGKPGDAKKYYEQALSHDPNAAVAANNLATHVAESGNIDVALQLAQTAKAKLPENASVSDTLGWIYVKKGLFGPAITSLREGINQNPKNPTIHYHLGLAYLKNGESRAAQQALEQALKLNPSFAHADDARRTLATIKL